MTDKLNVIDPDKSFSRQAEHGNPDKVFPDSATLQLRLVFSNDDMAKVRNWFAKTRKELGDKHVADISVDRMIFEAFAGGAVNPSVAECQIVEKE